MFGKRRAIFLNHCALARQISLQNLCSKRHRLSRSDRLFIARRFYTVRPLTAVLTPPHICSIKIHYHCFSLVNKLPSIAGAQRLSPTLRMT